jgi:hypothetical protein
MFMDVFQGCYKNGTAGTYDCRWFAALHMMMRIALPVVISTSAFRVFGLPIIVLLVHILLFLTTVFQPYKNPIHNTINISLLIVISLSGVSVMTQSMIHQYTRAAQYFTTIFSVTPLSFFLGLLLYKQIGHRRCTQRAYQKIRSLMQCVVRREACSEEFLPDRINQYEAILAEPGTDCTYAEQNIAQSEDTVLL